MTPLSECSQWHAEQARDYASKAAKLRRPGHWLVLTRDLAEADALELMAAKHRLWARSCAEADTDEPKPEPQIVQNFRGWCREQIK